MVKKGVRARTNRPLFLLLLLGTLVVGGAVTAQATETSISGSQGYGTTVHYYTARYNSYPQNYMAAWAVGWQTGGSMSMGVRNASGYQIARIDGVTSSWKSFYNNRGEPSISPGTFYMNVLITGACGGSGCGTQNWHGGLIYNVRYN